MRRERHTIFLCWLLLHHQLSTQPICSTHSAQSRLASPGSEYRLSRSEAGTQLTAFSQFSAHASDAWRHSHPLVSILIWDFYFDISEWHILSARAWTPALMLHLTNPCAKRKVLSLTKPKGKIYKTKSLRNYITSKSQRIYYYYYYYYYLRIFHTSTSWCDFAEICDIKPRRSPGLFSVFRLLSKILWFRWSLFFQWFPILSVSFLKRLKTFPSALIIIGITVTFMFYSFF